MKKEEPEAKRLFKYSHTPLPWRLEKSGSVDKSCEVYPEGATEYRERLAEFRGPDCEANAALFMAASEMRDAVKGLLTQIGDDYTMRHEIAACREIIARTE